MSGRDERPNHNYRILSNDLIGAAAEEYCPRDGDACGECWDLMSGPVVAVLRTLANEADQLDALSISVTTLRGTADRIEEGIELADRIEHPEDGE